MNDRQCLSIVLCTLFLQLCTVVNTQKTCSRQGSRIVREYFTRALGPIYEKNRLAIPLECVLSPVRDLYYRQELHKAKLSNDKWLCKFCNKTFYSEFYLDLHFTNRHNDTLLQSNQSICLADYCSIFRCDVLKKRKLSLRSLNPLARPSAETQRKKKKVINEQQLSQMKSQCISVINRCIPSNVKYDLRVKLQNQMHAEVCAFLTSKRYFELPTYRKALVNFASVFCLVIFLGMCLVAVGVVTHADWKFDEPEVHGSAKWGVNDSSTSAMGSSSSGTANNNDPGHGSKNSASSLRQRVRFKTHEGECQHGHSHGHGHSHLHHHHPPSHT